MSDYTPISLLTSFSNIFEKLICTKTYQHLIDNNLSDVERYGFRINLSTVKATHSLLNEVLNALNNKIVGGIYMTCIRLLFVLMTNIACYIGILWYYW
jgi:hypothetical protein